VNLSSTTGAKFHFLESFSRNIHEARPAPFKLFQAKQMLSAGPEQVPGSLDGIQVNSGSTMRRRLNSSLHDSAKYDHPSDQPSLPLHTAIILSPAPNSPDWKNADYLPGLSADIDFRKRAGSASTQ
jgi:hypothetical protein